LSFFPLAVIIPAYDEEEGIEYTIIELKKAIKPASLIVVDGKSRDRTVEIAKSLGVEAIIQKGKGKGSAIYECLTYLNCDVTYVALIDADYTYPAVHFKKMIEILDGNPTVGMVLGNRFNKIYELESMKDQFYVGNRIMAFVHKVCNGINLNDPLTGFRIIRYELLGSWKPDSKGFDIEIELNCHVKRMGYDIVEVPIKYRPRLGKKKLGFRHGLEILNRIISDTNVPTYVRKQ
jgi:glycosyltransferase involved in cell wall biosynthesis